MLGSADDPNILALMRRMETQSKRTIAAWAAAYARERFLPVYARACPGDGRLDELLAAARACAAGEAALSDLKPLLEEARRVAKAAEGMPAAQAAARAAAAAATAVRTPSSALGCLFYGAAAVAYDEIGPEADAAALDALAAREIERAAKSFQAAMIPDEPNPTRIKWNC
jgi:hypothetical protein